ncbi:MAG: hypothetical protein LAT81_15010 [Oceanicaulis sp.]|nr:hypothetical protein [Oceanicaulis sp.]
MESYGKALVDFSLDGPMAQLFTQDTSQQGLRRNGFQPHDECPVCAEVVNISWAVAMRDAPEPLQAIFTRNAHICRHDANSRSDIEAVIASLIQLPLRVWFLYNCPEANFQ